MVSFNPSALLRAARGRAALSQRAIAAQAGTARSVVARIERGNTDPSTGTLTRILHAAGLELRCELVVKPVADSHMLADVGRILSLTPEERLIEVRNLARFERGAKRV